MIIVARAFGGQHYYVIMILILARSYIKRRVVVVVVYAYFLGEISQVDTFSLEHVTGLQYQTVNGPFNWFKPVHCGMPEAAALDTAEAAEPQVAVLSSAALLKKLCCSA